LTILQDLFTRMEGGWREKGLKVKRN